MSGNYTDSDVRQIVAEVRRGTSLEELHCPRDRTVLKVFFSEFHAHVPNDPVQGVLCDDWGDVMEISVECPVCGLDGHAPRCGGSENTRRILGGSP